MAGSLTLVFPEPTLTMRAFPLADRGPTGRIVVTMTDITQRRRLEVLRRDFVANASHELKTPVAAVRALAETLLTALPDDPEAGRRFAERIGREAERLDPWPGPARPRGSSVGPSTSSRSTWSGWPRRSPGYADLAEERRVRLRTELQPHVSVRGDRAQLGLLLSNLLDNALRHTSAKGSVCVRLDTTESRAVLQVADTGEGIPAGELPRVFERFYRVDKARARRTGGTAASAWPSSATWPRPTAAPSGSTASWAGVHLHGLLPLAGPPAS